MRLGGREVRCRTCTWSEGTPEDPGGPVLLAVGRGGGGSGLHGRGGKKRGPISPGLTLRRLRPRLRPRGGDGRSLHATRLPRAGSSDSFVDPDPTSRFRVPTVPSAARCGLGAADLGRALCCLSFPQAPVPDLCRRGGWRYPAPSTSRELERTWRVVFPPPPTPRWCQNRASAPYRGSPRRDLPAARLRSPDGECNPRGAGAGGSRRHGLQPAVLAGCGKPGTSGGRVEGQFLVLAEPPGWSGRETDPSPASAWRSAGSLGRTAAAWAPLERPGGLPGGIEAELCREQ